MRTVEQHHLDRLPASISVTKVQKSLQTEQNGACHARGGRGGGLRLPRDIHIVTCTFDSSLCTSACNAPAKHEHYNNTITTT